MQEIVANCETGEVVIRELTPQEIAQQKRALAPANIKAVPKTGFGGPIGKELFNGNR